MTETREAKVAEFHKTLAYDDQLPSGRARLRRINLLYEEVDELEEALYNAMKDRHTDERAHILKELCDVQYVLSGLVLDIGYEDVFDEAFERVHLSNMAKVENGVELDAAGKVKKPKGWRAPDLSDLVT